MKISTIIPAYNCEKYIWQTLDCLALQSFKDIEIIVLLDNCSDKTEFQIRQYAKTNKHIQIKIVCFDRNMGPSHARNIGVRFARGEYIHFMDADDYINVDFYKNLYDAAVETDSDVACASFVNERDAADSITFDQKVVVCNRQDKIDVTHVDYHGYPCRYLFNRMFWKINHFAFPEDMYYCEDLVLMPCVIVESNHLVLVPDAVYFYKHREQSLLSDQTASRRRLRHKNYKQCLAVLQDFLRHNGLRRSMYNVYENKYRLFGLIPLANTKYIPQKHEKKTYVLGILIYKRKYVVKNHRQKIRNVTQ